MENRHDFLLKMYDQMFNDIDRHYKIVWQTMSILIGAFAVFSFVEKNIITIDIACSIIILLGFWVIALIYDSNYWYNRNLAIISNIERQFLNHDDQKKIHYYFGEHRKFNSMQTTLKIQKIFSIIIITFFVYFHFIKSILPGFKFAFACDNIKLEKTLPYIALVIGFLIVNWLSKKRKEDYLEFIENSPGEFIDSKGIRFGNGHPIK